MQQAKKITPPTPPSEPHLKLRRASVDQSADASESCAEADVIAERHEPSVPAGTELPWRCVKCGDAMDTLPSLTFRGRIRYRLCRDHVVSTIAQCVAGSALALLGIAAVGSRIIGDPLVGKMGTVFCLLAAAAGAGLIYRSLPVLTSPPIEGRYRLRRLHADVIDDLQRMNRGE